MISVIDTTTNDDSELMDYPLTFHKKCFNKWNGVRVYPYKIGETFRTLANFGEFDRHILDGDWRYEYESFDDNECAICDECNRRLKRYTDDCDCDHCMDDRNSR